MLGVNRLRLVRGVTHEPEDTTKDVQATLTICGLKTSWLANVRCRLCALRGLPPWSSAGQRKKRGMKRREFLRSTAAFGVVAALPSLSFARTPSSPEPNQNPPANLSNPLHPPAHGEILVAFVVSDGTVMIDLAGPWEVFSNVMIQSRGSSMGDQMPFHLYTVAETMQPVRVGGVKVQPDYTFSNAPMPKVLVIPAQGGSSKAMLDWIRAATKTTDVTMSVCTGATILAKTGLLSGKPATTHHDDYRGFAMQFPDVQLKRGLRYVEEGNLASSGGLSSGIDLALHVVDRYFGRDVALATADQLEYQGQGWLNPNSNAAYLQAKVSTDEHPLCQVCSMDVDRANAPKSVYKGKTYYFCSPDHKATFDAAPEK